MFGKIQKIVPLFLGAVLIIVLGFAGYYYYKSNFQTTKNSESKTKEASTSNESPSEVCKISVDDSDFSADQILIFTANKNCDNPIGEGQWYMNDQPIPGANKDQLKYKFTSPGHYKFSYKFNCNYKEASCYKEVNIRLQEGQYSWEEVNS